MTKNYLRIYLMISAVILLIGLQPIFQPATDALPDGLADAVESSLGWQVDGRDFSEQQKLTASDAAAGMLFGWSVAVEGDTALIGSLGHEAVYVFERSGGVWTEQPKLIASDGESGDHFGSSIMLDDDTVLIGAFGDNNEQGSVYVFEHVGGVWTEQQKLTASDGATDDAFGYRIALAGDTVLISAPQDQIDANIYQGSAYVFELVGGVWTEQQKLTASDGNVGDQFGFAIALAGDTALIGAVFDEVESNFQQGSVYAFERSGGVWTEQQKLTASDGAAQDSFGASVVLAGDTAFIGAFTDDNTEGSAYVFELVGGVWTEQQKLTASEEVEGAYFGGSIALEDDIMLIGASGNNAPQGVVYVFQDTGAMWVQQQTLTASDAGGETGFGYPVALSGDTALIGRLGDNSEQGSAYVFVNVDLPATDTPEPTATSTATTTPEPGITELIVNGDFEILDGEGKPDITPWTVKNASGDKAKCNKDKDGDGLPDKIVAYSGDCAFQFKNVVGEAGKLQQNIDLSGIVPASGDQLSLSYFAQSKGGATVKAKVVFKYADDTKTKISVESSGAEIYTPFAGVNVLTSGDVEKAKIGVKSGQPAGKVYLDLVSLKHSAGSVEPTPTPLPPTDTPEARLSGSTR